MKRLLDLVLAVAAVVALSPLLAVIALWVKLDSHGPAIFRQIRVGRDGELFAIHKFRTMRADSSGASVTVGADSRITRVGRVLRRTKLDELPQLFDVIAGHMSLVGPRPEVPEYVALWPVGTRDRVLSVRPGITDPASIHFAREADVLALQPDPHSYYVDVVMPTKLRMYEEYVSTRSIAGDLRLLLATFGALSPVARAVSPERAKLPVRYFAFANAQLPSTDYRVAYASSSAVCDVHLVLPDRPARLARDRFVRIGVTEGFSFRSVAALLRIPWILHRGHADVAHFFATQFVLAGPALARLVGVRSIVTVTGTGRVFGAAGLGGRAAVGLYRLLFRVTCTIAEAVLFQNDADLDFLRSFAGRRNQHKLRVVGTAIDPSPFRDTPPETARTRPRALMVARVQRSKGIDDFLALADSLADQAEFTLVGPPARGEDDLLHAVRRAHLDKTVEYLGGVTDAEVRDLYRQTNLVVIASESEGVPRVALEAAMSRRAVVAYDIPGCVSALPPECLVAAGDRAALRSRVVDLVNSPADRAKVASSAHEWVVERYGVDAFSRRMDDVVTAAAGLGPTGDTIEERIRP